MSGFATLFGGLWKSTLGIDRLLTITAVGYSLAGVLLIVGIKLLFPRDFAACRYRCEQPKSSTLNPAESRRPGQFCTILSETSVLIEHAPVRLHQSGQGTEVPLRAVGVRYHQGTVHIDGEHSSRPRSDRRSQRQQATSVKPTDVLADCQDEVMSQRHRRHSAVNAGCRAPHVGQRKVSSAAEIPVTHPPGKTAGHSAVQKTHAELSDFRLISQSGSAGSVRGSLQRLPVRLVRQSTCSGHEMISLLNQWVGKDWNRITMSIDLRPLFRGTFAKHRGKIV